MLEGNTARLWGDAQIYRRDSWSAEAQLRGAWDEHWKPVRSPVAASGRGVSSWGVAGVGRGRGGAGR